jgi:hypothetical protein
MNACSTPWMKRSKASLTLGKAQASTDFCETEACFLLDAKANKW